MSAAIVVKPPTPALVPSSAGRVLTPAVLWAMAGVVLLIWQAATWIGFFAASPHEITEFRDPHAVSWYAARFYEVTGVLTALFVGTFVVKQCMRERRLVLDAKFCIA